MRVRRAQPVPTGFYELLSHDDHSSNVEPQQLTCRRQSQSLGTYYAEVATILHLDDRVSVENSLACRHVITERVARGL
jgi:hypothetical protein